MDRTLAYQTAWKRLEQIFGDCTLFRVQSTRLADPFEPLNSSLAQSAEELGRW